MSLSTAEIVTVVALTVAALGVLLLFFSIEFSVPLPIGTIVLSLAAAIVLWVPWRWVPAFGALVALWILIGNIISGGLSERLTIPEVGPLLGAWMLLTGTSLAVIAGIVATVLNYN